MLKKLEGKIALVTGGSALEGKLAGATSTTNLNAL
jgi:hypothetical protein